jgi:hypothetical protein
MKSSTSVGELNSGAKVPHASNTTFPPTYTRAQLSGFVDNDSVWTCQAPTGWQARADEYYSYRFRSEAMELARRRGRRGQYKHMSIRNTPTHARACVRSNTHRHARARTHARTHAYTRTHGRTRTKHGSPQRSERLISPSRRRRSTRRVCQPPGFLAPTGSSPRRRHAGPAWLGRKGTRTRHQGRPRTRCQAEANTYLSTNARSKTKFMTHWTGSAAHTGRLRRIILRAGAAVRAPGAPAQRA